MISSSHTITVDKLCKTYQVPEREGGFGAAVRSFFKRIYRDVKAVDQVSFQIQAGEVVGFLGPNGAGKTTTLKMLSGLLHPSAGSARVLGFTPWELKPDYLRSMTLVMGQRNRLSWDIPASDSFLLNQAIYRIPDDEYKVTLRELDELLDLSPIMKKPVRNLSLGERMKCELAAGLLHRPKVLFLDEPTIGLDVVSQKAVRHFLRDYNRRYRVTILLTSHYMADIQELCERVIVIHKGRKIYDGALDLLESSGGARKKIITFLPAVAAHRKFPETWQSQHATTTTRTPDGKFTLCVSGEDVVAVSQEILGTGPVADITIEDVPLEDVIAELFTARN